MAGATNAADRPGEVQAVMEGATMVRPGDPLLATAEVTAGQATTSRMDRLLAHTAARMADMVLALLEVEHTVVTATACILPTSTEAQREDEEVAGGEGMTMLCRLRPRLVRTSYRCSNV